MNAGSQFLTLFIKNSRNAFASTLAALVELEGKEGDQTEERKRILAIADRQLGLYGKHQAFVYF